MNLPTPIKFEWDIGNKDKNWISHKIHYKEIEEVFFNKPIKFYIDDKHSIREKRFLVYGKTNNDDKLTIIFTVRNKKLRVISARLQNKKEKKIYAK